jgi:hypothetical protein
MTRGARATWAALAAYFALMLLWVYGVLDHAVGYGSDAKQVGLAVAAAAVHLATGVAIGRWWVVLLPLGTIALAVPAGYADEARLEIPIWVWVALIQAPIGGLLLVGGALGRRVVERRSTQGRSLA